MQRSVFRVVCINTTLGVCVGAFLTVQYSAMSTSTGQNHKHGANHETSGLGGLEHDASSDVPSSYLLINCICI